MAAHRSYLSRLLFGAVAFGGVLVFSSVFVHHVLSFTFKPLAAISVPFVVVFFAFASLLYTRGRALGRGQAQMRSFYAAERAMQGAVWYLAGVLLGVTLYGLLIHFGLRFDPNDPGPDGLWLLLFVAPWAMMQTGLICVTWALWVISPQFLRKVGAMEMRRRLQQ